MNSINWIRMDLLTTTVKTLRNVNVVRMQHRHTDALVHFMIISCYSSTQGLSRSLCDVTNVSDTWSLHLHGNNIMCGLLLFYIKYRRLHVPARLTKNFLSDDSKKADDARPHCFLLRFMTRRQQQGKLVKRMGRRRAYDQFFFVGLAQHFLKLVSIKPCGFNERAITAHRANVKVGDRSSSLLLVVHQLYTLTYTSIFHVFLALSATTSRFLWATESTRSRARGAMRIQWRKDCSSAEEAGTRQVTQTGFDLIKKKKTKVTFSAVK